MLLDAFSLLLGVAPPPKGVSIFDGATVYIARLGSAGDRRMARPCDTCWAKLKELGVKWIVYTIDGGWNRERMN